MKTSGLLTAGAFTAGVGLTGCSSRQPQGFNFNRLGKGDGLKLSYQPYELELRHVFTVSSYSRKTTPGVQIRIDYEGFTGYGEASMPPYLGESIEETWVFEDSHVAIMTADKTGFKTVGIYDKCNYGFDEIKKIATECVFENETLEHGERVGLALLCASKNLKRQ